MSEWVLHCAVNRRLIRRSQPTRHTALEDACSQLLQGHTVNRIVGPNETINAKQIKEWPRGATDAGAIREGIHQAQQARCRRCRSDLRGGWAPDDALCAGQDG